MSLKKKSYKDKILVSMKLKAFAGNKITVTQMFCFVLDLVENMVRKRENDGSHKFSKGFLLRSCV